MVGGWQPPPRVRRTPQTRRTTRLRLNEQPLLANEDGSSLERTRCVASTGAAASCRRSTPGDVLGRIPRARSPRPAGVPLPRATAAHRSSAGHRVGSTVAVMLGDEPGLSSEVLAGPLDKEVLEVTTSVDQRAPMPESVPRPGGSRAGGARRAPPPASPRATAAVTPVSRCPANAGAIAPARVVPAPGW